VFVGGIPKAVTVTDEQLHEFASQGGEVSLVLFDVLCLLHQLFKDCHDHMCVNSLFARLQVYSCAVLKDPGSGLNRGYGFIKYKSKDVANSAMEKLNNTEMKDHPGHQVYLVLQP
jgi:RNA recognition motif-containing protein